MTQQITTKRLTLRPFRSSDAGDVARLLNNENVARWLTTVPQPYGEADAVAFFDLMSQCGHTAYAACRDDTLVGCVSIVTDLGYWYGEPFWGQGYATEAACALTADYFARTDTPLTSGYHLGNAGSKHVLEKLGFEPSETRRVHAMSRGSEVTIQGMVLTKARWEAAQ